MSKRRAVSPVVATLLLILIAVAAAVVLYAWVSSLNSSAKGSGAENTGSAIVIEEAKLIKNLTRYNVSGDANSVNITDATAVKVWVRNIANRPIDNGTWALYIIDSQTGAIVAVANKWTFNKSLTPGEIYVNVTSVTPNGISVNATNNTYIYITNGTVLAAIDVDKDYVVKVVAPNGVSDAVVVKPEEEVID